MLGRVRELRITFDDAFRSSAAVFPELERLGLPVTIFVFSESPDPGEQAAGWAAALVLILFVLVLNIVAKIVAGRQRRKHEGA